MNFKNKTIVLAGHLIPPSPELRKSKAGKDWIRFDIKTDRRIIPSIAFEEVAVEISTRVLPDTKCEWRGYQQDGNFIINRVLLPESDDRPASIKDSLISYYGSIEEWKKRSLEERSYYANVLGFVRVPIKISDNRIKHVYRHLKKCVCIDGTFLCRMEYLMDTLGTDRVNKRLREWRESVPFKFGKSKQVTKGISMSTDSYEAVIASLLKEAGYSGEDLIETEREVDPLTSP